MNSLPTRIKEIADSLTRPATEEESKSLCDYLKRGMSLKPPAKELKILEGCAAYLASVEKPSFADLLTATYVLNGERLAVAPYPSEEEIDIDVFTKELEELDLAAPPTTVSTPPKT